MRRCPASSQLMGRRNQEVMTQGGTGKEKALINWVGKELNRLHADFMSKHVFTKAVA